jgi:hypothetical protein
MDVPAVRKRHGLFAVQLGTENSSDLIKSEAEARGYGAGCEPACGLVAWLDAPMVLLQMVVEMVVGPVRHLVPKDMPNGARVGVVAVGGHAVGRHRGHRPRRAEEGLSGCEVPRVAEPYIDEIPVVVNRAV